MVNLQTILIEVQNNQAADQLAAEIGKNLDDIFKKELQKASQQQNEAVLTTAAIVLAIPGFLNTIAKVTQAFYKKFSRGIDLTKQDPKTWYNVLEKFTEKIDSYIGLPFDSMLKPLIQDSAKRKKVVNLIKGLAIATMAIIGGINLDKTIQTASVLKGLTGGFFQEISQSIGQKNLPDLVIFAKKAIPTYLS
jgi:hypothetical protein